MSPDGVMKAQVLNRIVHLPDQPEPLNLRERPIPVPNDREILLRVSACGVCHTELDEIEGRMGSRLPVIPGHQVVGRVEQRGRHAGHFKLGERAGVAWIYSACGRCDFCTHGFENLCPGFQATGRDVDGGYAEYMTVPEAFAYPIPDIFTDVEAAPLLCAGAIGYRSLCLTGLVNGRNLGLTGFGGSGHLVLKMAQHRYPDSRVFVFARNPSERSFAMELGAVWAGDTTDCAPEPLHVMIDTTPAWKPVIEALGNLAPGGRLVINAIRKEGRDQAALLDLDYPRHLWMEKEIKSVANVCRRDVAEFLQLAADMALKPEVEEYSLEEANLALYELKTKKIRGAKVLHIA